MPLWVGRVDVLAAAALAALLLLLGACALLAAATVGGPLRGAGGQRGLRLVLAQQTRRGFAADYGPAPARFTASAYV